MQQGLPLMVDAVSSSMHGSSKQERRRSGAGRVGCWHRGAATAGTVGRAACNNCCAALRKRVKGAHVAMTRRSRRGAVQKRRLLQRGWASNLRCRRGIGEPLRQVAAHCFESGRHDRLLRLPHGRETETSRLPENAPCVVVRADATTRRRLPGNRSLRR